MKAPTSQSTLPEGLVANLSRSHRRAIEKAHKGRSKPPRMRKVWSTEIDPIQHAIDGASITPRTKLDALLAREWAGLDAFTRGQATLRDWSDLVNVNNLAQTMAGMGVGPEVMPHCHTAEQALEEAAKRFQKLGRMGLSGPGLNALREVIEYHDLQRASIPRSQYEEAIRLTGARIKSGHATVDLGKLEPQC